MKVRTPAIAGTFYPAGPHVLRKLVAELLADSAQIAGSRPKALIVPHAGLPFSGPVAASAYSSVIPFAEQIDRVLMFGPAHRVAIPGIGASTAEAFATTLGQVPIDLESVEKALCLPQVHYSDSAHRFEHSLEIQLPFLQVILNQFRIVPFVVGKARPDEVAEVMELLWGGPETLVVVSSDLSHFHDHATASRTDRRTADLIESGDTQELIVQRACGFRAIRGLLKCARNRHLSVNTLDIRDSSEAGGDTSRVVGYGAFLVS